MLSVLESDRESGNENAKGDHRNETGGNELCVVGFGEDLVYFVVFPVAVAVASQSLARGRDEPA